MLGEQHGEQVAALGERGAVRGKPGGVDGGEQLGREGLADH